jgi:hypothetical protein
MVEPVLYFRGLPREAIATSPPVLQDLKAIGGLPPETVEAIRTRLSAAEGFLDYRSLAAIIRDVVRDENLSKAVQNGFLNLAPEHVEGVLSRLSERKEDDSFGKADLDKLRGVLPKLIQAYPALTRFAKAERLAKATGQRLESVELICDLRPIFDDSRQNIEGMMPYTRLSVTALGADGLPNSFEAELTWQQVHDLGEKAAKAEKKLAVMRKTVEDVLPGGLPELPLTRVARKESSDE